MIEAVLFDLDGTLLDTSDDLGAALNYVLSNHGLPVVSKAAYSSAISNGVAALLDVGFGSRLAEFDKDSLRQQVLNYYEQNLSVHSHVFELVEEMLSSLRDRKIKYAIMTNKPAFLTLPLLKRISALRDIEVVVCGDTLSVAKPHPEPLLLCAQQLEVAPEACIYVGDAERDIIAAKSAKMTSAAAMWGFIPSKQQAISWQADLYLTNPMSLISHI
ncbi:HAD family hydrolase [Pseudoalteromonas sp. T1lg65]|uniref:HAD family hydrolase n=1 Tax=Pseudoalteromonas sp. T1lg65 TaxID=2077101 RepID=UPI003F78EF91